jgi:hypothetical protein
MLAFACPVCERLVTFESSRCLNCGSALGFDFAARSLRPVPDGDGPARRCANQRLAACNWLAADGHELCPSCALTRTRPHDSDEAGLGGFATAEGAKRRLLFELADLGLPIVGWREESGGLAFDLLSSERGPVTTGHADGVITLDLDETDPSHRERMRVRLEEPYRTVLGHFRHEIGHYYQSILVLPGSDAETRCRQLFGDEREDYKRAMERYYASGPPSDWRESYVSAYATMHPWEDFAETFSHYLHVCDTLQTAAAYGVRVDGPAIATTDPLPLHARAEDAAPDVAEMLAVWIPLTYALNAISRSMGLPDLYPFILGARVESKLAFIDSLLDARAPAGLTRARGGGASI